MGVLLLGEKMMCHGWSGIAMLVTGIALVATDPGEKVEEGGGASTEGDGPPLMKWLWIALCCAMAYALYNSKSVKSAACALQIQNGRCTSPFIFSLYQKGIGKYQSYPWRRHFAVCCRCLW